MRGHEPGRTALLPCAHTSHTHKTCWNLNQEAASPALERRYDAATYNPLQQPAAIAHGLLPLAYPPSPEATVARKRSLDSATRVKTMLAALPARAQAVWLLMRARGSTLPRPALAMFEGATCALFASGASTSKQRAAGDHLRASTRKSVRFRFRG